MLPMYYTRNKINILFLFSLGILAVIHFELLAFVNYKSSLIRKITTTGLYLGHCVINPAAGMYGILKLRSNIVVNFH